MGSKLDPDFYVGYLYEFVVKFPDILHSNYWPQGLSVWDPKTGLPDFIT